MVSITLRTCQTLVMIVMKMIGNSGMAIMAMMILMIAAVLATSGQHNIENLSGLPWCDYEDDGNDVVSCPTRWSLLLAFGFLYWSSSWWWQPHIAGCKFFWPLLRAGMTVFDQFFCKMYFLYVSRSRKKILAVFWGVLPPQKRRFFHLGVQCQNWGANVRNEEKIGNCNEIL